MDFCTLGMLIIDEIQHPAPRPPSYDVLGGAGTFATLGARLFRPPPASAKVSWTIHRGYDFPESLQQEIDSWQTGVQWIDTPERQTTRAWNGYDDETGDDFRSFHYTTAKIRIDESHLTDEMLFSKSFHMVCSPERCIQLVEGIRTRRRTLTTSMEEPIFVWEPVPDLCNTEALESVKRAATYVNVVSPNSSELASLFAANETAQEENQHMEQRCLAILGGLFGDRSGAVVVRCGSKGCYLRSRTEKRWLPAYWTSSDSKDKVVDPTGGGNQFLGGLCIGLQSTEPEALSKLERGAIFGNIAASFAIEQVGVPKLSIDPSKGELWNGEAVIDRLDRYIDRLRQHPT